MCVKHPSYGGTPLCGTKNRAHSGTHKNSYANDNGTFPNAHPEPLP